MANIHATFTVERSYSHAPEMVFAAFTNSEKMRRWFADGDHHDVLVFVHDFRVGGAQNLKYRFNASTQFSGVELSNDGAYEDIVANERVVITSTMTFGDKRISVSLITLEIVPAANGTTLTCTNQSVYFDGADGPEMRKMGWQSLLDKLALELEK